MRIGFLGKGGSGKTTISASFITYLTQNKKFVLAIDADVNVHLAKILAQEYTDIHPIGGMFPEVAQYMKGSRTDIGTMVATTPPSLKSQFIRPQRSDLFLQKFGRQISECLSLLTIGTYDESDVGHTCYHGKLNTLEIVYHHMLDGNNEYVVADATAGIDNVGTSLFFSYDINVFVVEPTLKSIQVFKDFKKIADKEGVQTVAIINKCEPEDEHFVQKYIDKKDIIGYVSRSVHIKHMEQGDTSAFSDFVEEQKSVFVALQEYIRTHASRDWDAYYKRLLKTHIKNSNEWWNDYYKEQIDKQLDLNFSYDKVLTNQPHINTPGT